MPCARVYQALSLGVLLALGCAKEPPLPPALPAERWAAYDDAKGFPTADQLKWPPPSVLDPPTHAPPPTLAAPQLPRPQVLAAIPPPAPRRGRQPTALRKSGDQRYDYEPFKEYPVLSAPNHPTAIVLPVGETLATPLVINACSANELTEYEEAKGCWSIGEGDIGPADTSQHVVIVRPSKAGLHTTMHLFGRSGRTYFMGLRSQDAKGDLAITWNGVPPPTAPSLPVQPIQPVQYRPPALTSALPVGGARPAQSISLDRLFTAYTIEVTSKQRPPWVPVQVFDDGTRTFIRFKEDLAFTASPAVFGVHADRSPAIVEFSPYQTPDGGLTYIVNGLHPLLLLSGVDRMEVRITRGSHAR